MRVALIVLTLLVAGPAVAAKKEPVVVQYDRFDDQTTVSMREVRLPGTDLGLLVAFTCRGKEIVLPDSGFILLHYQGPEWRYLRQSQHRISLIVRGETVEPRIVVPRTDVGHGGWVEEKYVAPIPMDWIVELLSGRADGRIGQTEFKVPADKPGFKDMLSYILNLSGGGDSTFISK